jgi:hypothetical protein
MKIKQRTRNLFLLVVLLGAIVGGWAVWYVFYKPHRDISSEKPAYTLTSQALSDAIKTDTAAFARYVDKALLIEGAISEVEGSHISMGNVICNMDSSQRSKMAALKSGDAVKIQGRLSTYNDLMEEIVMDKCVLK